MVNRSYWSPLAISILFYAVLLGIALLRIHALTHGLQIYLLDDTYIHLSIARNLLLHGTYGLSPTEPAMAASSILWPFLLAGVGKLFGLHLLLPLVLNIIFALALLALSLYILRQNGITSPVHETAALLLFVLAFPLVAMTLDGMEHVLYGFLFLLFLLLTGRIIGEEQPSNTFHEISLLLAAALLTSCRYEGVFAVFAAWVLLVRRRTILATLMGIAGALPVILFGLFSRSQGGMWVPNSLLMKTQGHTSLFQRLIAIPREILRHIYIWECGLMCLLLLLGWIAFKKQLNGLTRAQRSMLFVFLGTAVLHIEFARLVAGTPRYESYMMGAGVLLIAICFVSMRNAVEKQHVAFPLTGKILLVLALLPIIVYRGIWWEIVAPNAAKGIYLQQYQAARFFARYYHGQPFLANDVGVVSYYTDGRCLDLWGLATNAIAIRKTNGTMSTDVMRQMADNAHIKVGFIYAQAFYGPEAPPAEWVDVETWTIPLDPGYTVANDTIHLYAMDQEDAATLRAHLNEFRPSLPAGVTARTPDGKLLN